MAPLPSHPESVYAIFDYYDGPTQGIAEYKGVPHCFKRIFDVLADEFSDSYALAPASSEAVQLGLARSKIFLRWYEAFKRGDVLLSTHPALPADRARYDDLVELIGDRLDVLGDGAFQRRAEFHVDALTSLGTVEWRDP